MGKNSAIEWCNHTWNPFRGCHKISAGCKNCYMFREQKRYGHDPNVVVRCSSSTFNAPLKWAREADIAEGPVLVFTCSWSDFFIEEADPWRDEAWEIIRQTPQLTYLILTKRPELIAKRVPPDWWKGYPLPGFGGYSNVALGVSVENQEALGRVLKLREVPAQWYFLSLEPLLGPIDFTSLPYCWDWVIIGGESDRTNPRPLDLLLVRDLIEDCHERGSAVFIKQLGTAWAREVGAKDWKGADWSEWPEDLRVRQFPRILWRGRELDKRPQNVV